VTGVDEPPPQAVRTDSIAAAMDSRKLVLD
jgi:hypothetical protein